MNRREGNTRKKQRYRSGITRKILLQYILCMAGFVFSVPMVILLAYTFFASFTWYDSDPLWHILKFVRDYVLIFAGMFVLIGWVAITYYFIAKPLRYLDDVVEASASLAALSETPVRLPGAMHHVENEMNLVREQAIRNAALAREAEQRKNDLIVYLAHDLKTPLTSVIGYLTLLQDEPQISVELRAKYTGIALAKAQRLEDLLNEFFDITRFNLTAICLETEQINISRMAEQLASEFLPVLSEKGLFWKLSIEPGLELVCDPDKMERVFDNLIRNAVNYSYPNSAIGLRLSRQEGRVVLQVSNSGKTIPPEKLERIFEQFFRLDAARSSQSGGSGLGLAIAKEIVELHGGKIFAESKNEKIVFTVVLS